MGKVLSELYQRMKAETQSWFRLFGLLLGIFMLAVSVTNVTRQLFDFELLPVFQNSLDGFQAFVNYVIGNTVFLGVEVLFDASLYIVNALFSAISGLTVPKFEVNAPKWLSDLSIISIVLLRAQTHAMGYSAPASSLTMVETQRAEWEWSILNCRQPLRALIKISWLLVLVVYRVKKFFEWPLRRMGLEKTARLLGLFTGGSLLLGIFYFLHDALSIPATSHLRSVHANDHRVFFAWTVASLTAALFASAFFIVWNGLFLQ